MRLLPQHLKHVKQQQTLQFTTTMSRLITDVGLAPLTVSLVSSSLLLFGNGILEIVGPVPIIRNKDSPLSLSPKQKVQIWATYFRGVAVSRLTLAQT